MKAVADALGVARASLCERAAGRTKPREHYHKAGDLEVLPILRRLVDERPTYGHRRITALLNRERQGAGQPKLNPKRVLRLMQQHGLTLQAAYRAARSTNP